MFLIKAVNLLHRDAALEKGRIRVGTINYYRDIEDRSRRDATEGLGHIVWNGKHLLAADHNRIFTPFDKVKLADDWTISNRNVPIHGSYPNFNAYTFCYSEVRNIREIASTSSGKATHYYFIKDIRQFVLSVGRGLVPVASEMIRKYDHDGADRLIESLKVTNVTYRVNYSDEPKYRVVNESNVKAFNPKSFHPQDFFQKSKSFAYEQEVRTIWLFWGNDTNGKKQLLSLPHPDEKYADLELGKLPISRKRHRNRYEIKTSPLKPADA